MVHILICDDDTVFTQELAQKLRSLPVYSAKAMSLQCLTDVRAMRAEALSKFDILFLDIDLGEKNGIDLARSMRQNAPGAVLIFVTNFSEYAPEGYEVDAFRYLSKEDLDKRLPAYFSDALAACRKRQQTVEIFCEGESVPVPVRAVSYVESLGRKQCLHMVGWSREQLYTRLTMARLEELLCPHGFLRIHKQYLVNMAYLQTLQSTGAILSSGLRLPTGARGYRESKQKFLKWQAQQLW